MRLDLLLDTHAVLWLAAGDQRARGLIEVLEKPTCTPYVSASTWLEIAIKRSIGKLEASILPLRAGLRRHGAHELPLTATHALQLERLPLHHADPFDRMLIAQAICEELSVATVHPSFAAYEGVSVIWP